MKEEKVVKTTCGLCAPGICGMLVHVKDGKMVRVEGDPDCPFSRGALCTQGLAAVELVYHPDRLKYPLRRMGKRGEGKWERISWDEALEIIAENLKTIRDKYGPLALAMATGTGRPQPTHAMRRFLNIWGTPNRIGYPHNCLTPRRIASLLLYGEKFILPDINYTNCLVLWGTNISHTGLCRGGSDVSQALRRGVKTIVVDPYYSPLASKADLWLQVRPHGDCALALAMMNVIINENLYDREFVQNWVNGFDQLVQHTKEFTPEWAEPICWVSADKIREAARMLATNRPSSICIGVAVQFGMNTTHTLRAIFSIPALIGDIDGSGGENMLPFCQ